VTVTRIPPSLTLTTGSTTFTYEPTVHVTAHLGTTSSNRIVSIYAKPFASTSRKLLKTGTVNSTGILSVSYRAPYNTTFSVVFTGDKYYAPKTVTRVVYVKAKVTESLTGYYTSETIGGHTYRLYHRSNRLHAHAAVSPDKHGQCVNFEVQEHYRGAWHPSVTSACVKLNTSSKASITFNVSHADLGHHYRIRADYLPADNRNRGNKSAWLYVIITS